MAKHAPSEIKHVPSEHDRFQLERIILFTDAVFAIAITLLIIEIKVPHFEHTGKPDEHQLWEATTHQVYEWIGFLISFLVIGSYWRAHHRIFGYVVHYDAKLLFRNLLFLMPIVIMPYTTAFYSSYLTNDLPLLFYCLNVSLAGILQLWIWQHITNPRYRISESIPDIERKYNYLRGIIPVLVFLLSALFIPVGIWLPRLLFLLIFVLHWLLSNYFRRKYEFVGY